MVVSGDCVTRRRGLQHLGDAGESSLHGDGKRGTTARYGRTWNRKAKGRTEYREEGPVEFHRLRNKVVSSLHFCGAGSKRMRRTVAFF